MARSEARLQFGIWRGGLDGLGAHAKLMYCVLLTEPSLNHCGVGVVRLERWAKDASLTIADTEKAIQELAAGGWVLVDDDSGEVFVRTLIRNDGIAAQPYVLKGALREAMKTESKAIRLCLASELRKLPPKQPDGTSKRGGRVVYPDPYATADLLDPPRPPQASKKGSETLFDVDPSERVSGGSRNHPEREGGGGGGGGTSSSVGTQVQSSAARQDAPSTPTQIAQALAKTYYDRVPLTNFAAVMKIAKQALAAGYDPKRIEAGMSVLADERRTVSANALRIAMDGPPLRAVSGGYEPFRNPTDQSVYDEPLLEAPRENA